MQLVTQVIVRVWLVFLVCIVKILNVKLILGTYYRDLWFYSLIFQLIFFSKKYSNWFSSVFKINLKKVFGKFFVSICCVYSCCKNHIFGSPTNPFQANDGNISCLQDFIKESKQSSTLFFSFSFFRKAIQYLELTFDPKNNNKWWR